VFLLVGLGILHGVASRDSPYQVDDQTTDGYEYENECPYNHLPCLHRVAMSIEIDQTDYHEHEKKQPSRSCNPNHATTSCADSDHENSRPDRTMLCTAKPYPRTHVPDPVVLTDRMQRFDRKRPYQATLLHPLWDSGSI
jgi:hypothetical protein